ncbi:MAG: hypothetical protein Q7R43_04075 [Candidatus Daviesbacteria bacterium]|nr:hypothetical protein [Candidatus Daviesbacteria bacterium]
MANSLEKEKYFTEEDFTSSNRRSGEELYEIIRSIRPGLKWVEEQMDTQEMDKLITELKTCPTLSLSYKEALIYSSMKIRDEGIFLGILIAQRLEKETDLPPNLRLYLNYLKKKGN